jgi:hypothetical protein
MKPQRIPPSGSLPELDLSNQSIPLLNPKSMADIQLHAPPEVSAIIRNMRWDWFFDLSCNIAGQHRDLGVTGLQGRVEDATILVNSIINLTPAAAAHAWVIALAQRAAMEIRQLEQTEGNSHRTLLAPGVGELAGVAFLAASHHHRGTGRRLSVGLQRLALDVTAALGSGASVQFLHRRPVQLASPVIPDCAVPLAAYRVRYQGCTVEEVRRVMAQIVQERFLMEHGGDQLMLSQS